VSATAAISVRPARREDAALIVRFSRALAWESEGLRLDEARLARGVEGVFRVPERGRYRIAEREGRAVGCLMLTGEWSDWRAGWFWWIQSVYVVPDARRAGVFRALYHSVLEEARSREDVCGLRLYVEHANARALATYAGVGMKEAPYRMFEVDFVLERG